MPYGVSQQAQYDYANYRGGCAMHGGGVISWGVTANKVKWTGNMYVLPTPGSESSQRYIGWLASPSSGVTDVNNTERADANGITLNDWESLWLMHTRGSTANAGITLKVANWSETSTQLNDLFANEDAYLICVRNGETDALIFANGIMIPNGKTVSNGGATHDQYAQSGHNHDATYLGKTAKAADSTLLSGNAETVYNRYRGSIDNSVLDTDRDPGVYTVSYTGDSSMLLELSGAGSAPRTQMLFTYSDNIYFRVARDTKTNFDSVGMKDKYLWHSGNFNPANYLGASAQAVDSAKLGGNLPSYYAAAHNHPYAPDSHPGTGGSAHANVIAGGAAGFMTGAQATKLAGIADNANNYSHPVSHAASMIDEDATHRFVSDTEKSAWDSKADAPTRVTKSVAFSGVTPTANSLYPFSFDTAVKLGIMTRVSFTTTDANGVEIKIRSTDSVANESNVLFYSGEPNKNVTGDVDAIPWEIADPGSANGLIADGKLYVQFLDSSVATATTISFSAIRLG